MSGEGLFSFSNMLQTLNPTETGVSFQGKSLKLDTPEDWDKIVDAINKCEKLDFLNLEGNTLGVEAANAISKALMSKPELKKALWKDIFTGRMKEEIPKALSHLGNGLTTAGARLVELDMSDNAFGPIGVEGLVDLLRSPTCYHLEILKLHNNGLGIFGGKLLSKALLQCYENSLKQGKPFALKVFIAGRNRLENEGAKALSEVFEKLGSLEEIMMPQNGIYRKGIAALSKSFINNKNLKVVNLNDNTVTKAGAVSIAKALPHLQKLKVLNLGDCLLRTGGAEVLADALSEGHNDLEELYLGSNEIKYSGGLAIAEAVKNKDKLKVLNLNGNSFGEEGCESIKNAMSGINKASVLESLSEDEGELEDDEEDADDDEDQDDESGSEHEDENGIESDKSINNSKTNTSFTKSPLKNESELDKLSNIIQTMSVVDPETDPVYKFLTCWTADNLKALTWDIINNYIKNNEASSPNFYLEKVIPLIMKVSSLSIYSKDDVKTHCLEITHNLYKSLFTWANDKDQISAVNNTLVVYLGLIKSEDKNFKINWLAEGSISALRNAISMNIVPKSTEQTLNCCLTRKQN